MSTSYEASTGRYESMAFRRCGRSGLKLPIVSLGLWHNFGGVDDYAAARQMCLRAFDLGITHFDLANNYGPPPGAAEATFGRIVREDLAAYRDELVVSTKAGYLMWPGPYGDGGSRKYLLASLDASLRRLGLPYVDVFYSHRPDGDTPPEETMGALDAAVRAGKSLYAGVSSYDAQLTLRAAHTLRTMGTPCLLHQPKYNVFERWIERPMDLRPDEAGGGAARKASLLDVLAQEGIGCIVFSPLAQGMLSDRYLNGIPADSRVAKPHGFLTADRLTEPVMAKVRSLDALARRRDQSLAQLALAWCLRDERITSVLIGASRVEQIEENLRSLAAGPLSAAELEEIERILA
jgi:L-glyceraldehyde 3-phosphate reductase